MMMMMMIWSKCNNSAAYGKIILWDGTDGMRVKEEDDHNDDV